MGRAEVDRQTMDSSRARTIGYLRTGKRRPSIVAATCPHKSAVIARSRRVRAAGSLLLGR
jgi:hypothetical protein